MGGRVDVQRLKFGYTLDFCGISTREFQINSFLTTLFKTKQPKFRKWELEEECAAKKMSWQEKDIIYFALHDMVQWIVKDSETEEECIANMGKVVALWPSKVEQSDTFMQTADFWVFPPPTMPHPKNWGYQLIMKRSLRLNCYSVNTFYGYHLESVSNPPRFRCNDAYLSDCASAYSKRKPNRRSTQSATVAKGADDCLHRFRWLHWTCGVLEYSKPIAFIRVSNLMTLDDVNLSRHHKLELEDWIHSIVCWSGWERNALNNMQYRLKTEWNRLWVLVDFVMRQEKVYKLIEMAS